MGALARASLYEIDEIVDGDADWWPSMLGAIAEDGQPAVWAESKARGWAANAIMAWVYKDAKRTEQHKAAIDLAVGKRAWATGAIVDAGPPPGEDVARDALRVKQAFGLAGKVDRVNWGESIKVERSVSVTADAALVGFAGALLERLARPGEAAHRVIDGSVDEDI